MYTQASITMIFWYIGLLLHGFAAGLGPCKWFISKLANVHSGFYYNGFLKDRITMKWFRRRLGPNGPQVLGHYRLCALARATQNILDFDDMVMQLKESGTTRALRQYNERLSVYMYPYLPREILRCMWMGRKWCSKRNDLRQLCTCCGFVHTRRGSARPGHQSPEKCKHTKLQHVVYYIPLCSANPN